MQAPTFKQENRPLQIITPLGEDALFVTGFQGDEAISTVFCYAVDLAADGGAAVQFERLLGQNVTLSLRLSSGEIRYFNGLVNRLVQGGEDYAGSTTFKHYRVDIVPELWLLTKRVQFRIFQQLSVPDILSHVLNGLAVEFDLTGHYPRRNYCVQYGESDFALASRLMEEEGIFYYFKHSQGQHQMVLTDGKTPMIAGESTLMYNRTGHDKEMFQGITKWEKAQEIRAAEYTLRDYCFQLPLSNLEAKEHTLESLSVGESAHKLKNVGNQRTEIYEYPGGYGQRFDDVSSRREVRPHDVNRVLDERQRVARLRMEQEEAASVEITGESDYGHLVPGHKFELSLHFDSNGAYLLKTVHHNAAQAGHRAGEDDLFNYSNKFTCVPQALRYRPQRGTPKPKIEGVQTAVVTGNLGDEIYCDQYGRVKVQFHWDREGKMDAASSCWIRVAQVWAGNGWGAFFWPRVGHEVVVAFENGDPDRPLIVGSVYNAKNMPWFDLPVNQHLAGFKSASFGGTKRKNFNGIVFNDKSGKEHVAIHSEGNLSLNSEADKMIHSGKHKGERVAVANAFTVGKLIPGGGSGGGDFDEGNPMPEPTPTGVFGMNCAVTYGDNMQMACPVNHQLAIGNNTQICINPLGLLAGREGGSVPEVLQSVMGGSMGGSMQFTIGTSAQFTLGQSFEISVGPPKIEIHQGYDHHPGVNILCTIAGAIAAAFAIAYDVMSHSAKTTYDSTHEKNDVSTTGADSVEQAEKTAEQGAEQRGDKERALGVVAYQLLMDAALIAILALENAEDQLEWTWDDVTKDLFKADVSIMKAWKAPCIDIDDDPKGSWWTRWGTLSFGCPLAVAEIAADIEAGSHEG